MMGHTLNLFYLLWSHIVLYSVFGWQDLHYQELSQQHQNLTSVPDRLDPRLRGLDLSHNMINQLGLLALPDLKRLDLSYNHLELLDDLVFQYVPELIELNLAHNKLNNIERNSKALQPLQMLRKLDMSLNSLDGDAVELYISSMSSLEHLDLTGNTLMKLMSKSFTGAKGLKMISLENNLISDIETGTFKALTELESLTLAQNNLAHICDFKLNQVKFLNLSRNSIEFFVTHEDEELYKLEILDLSHNNLLFFPIVPKTSLLRHLHLQHNMLGAMSAEVQVPEINALYKELTCAENSTLTENDNIYSNWRHMPLVYMDLSNNQFRYFPLQTLRYLTVLETLNLSSNCLSDVSYDSAQDGTVGNFVQPLLPSLQFFDLQNNYITHFSPLSLQSLLRIETLNLRQNTVKPCEPRPKPDNVTKASPQHDLFCVNFSQIRTLRHLNLQDNGIKALHPKTFYQTPLLSLKLAGNKDLMIHLGALEGVQRSLKSLSISEINMTNTDWSLPCFTALTQLNISYNSLVAIPDSIVCSPIRELDVRNNAFVSLDDSLVANLSVHLQVIYISGNTLNCCDTNWLIILRKAKVNIPDLYKSECISAYNGSLIPLTEFLHNPSLFCLYQSGAPELTFLLVIIFIVFVSTVFATLVVCIQKVCCRRGSFIV